MLAKYFFRIIEMYISAIQRKDRLGKKCDNVIVKLSRQYSNANSSFILPNVYLYLD